MNTSKTVVQPVLLRRPRAPKQSQFVNLINRTGCAAGAESLPSSTLAQELLSIVSDEAINAFQYDSQSSATKSTQQRQQTFYHHDKMPPHHTSLQELSTQDVRQKHQSLVRPLKQKGPDPLPPRLPRQQPVILHVPPDDDAKKYYRPPEFTLQDFITRLSKEENVPVSHVEKIVRSPFTYNKMQKVLHERCQPKSTKLSKQELRLPADVPEVQQRIPRTQLLIEMAAIIKEHLSKGSGLDLRSLIQAPLSQDLSGGTDIIFYHKGSLEHKQQYSQLLQDTELPGTDSILHGPSCRHFHDSRRTGSPFAMPDEEVISPSELGVLDSLLSGGRALSLKAQFISLLPDVQLLFNTVEYINLSFNNFQTIPADVFNMSCLSVLLMRNNPLTEIPTDIAGLANLKTLVVSFCLLTSLPVELFSLVQLEQLDVSYNKLTSLPSEMQNMVHLEELNVEGNQLTAMPAGILQLSQLKCLQVANNFMHPVFWTASVNQQPQHLVDLSCLAVNQQKFVQLPSDVCDILNKAQRCDSCAGPRYGSGICAIRPVSRIFGVKNLPIQFNCCSVECRKTFLSSTKELEQLLYASWQPTIS